MRQQIAAANWKMNLTLDKATSLLDELTAQSHSLKSNQKVVIAVPFPYLYLAKEKLQNKVSYYVSAQNCSDKKNGAFTGETSAEMLQSMDVAYVVIGHSERREIFGETNAQLQEKVKLSLENGLVPIFCCGEPLEIREAGTQNDYVTQQLKESLFSFSADEVAKIVIAYEPIWAIGTGKTATADQAQEMHAHLRGVLAEAFGNEVAQQIPILYGGSVKGSNANEIFSKPDVDGGLVGGASLIADDFSKIIDALQ